MLESAPGIEFVILVGLGDSFEKQLTLARFTWPVLLPVTNEGAEMPGFHEDLLVLV